jgi:hypothetical protein
MKLTTATQTLPRHRTQGLLLAKLTPRTTYPSVAIHPLHRSRWAKLAWIFGFGR